MLSEFLIVDVFFDRFFCVVVICLGCLFSVVVVFLVLSGVGLGVTTLRWVVVFGESVVGLSDVEQSHPFFLGQSEQD